MRSIVVALLWLCLALVPSRAAQSVRAEIDALLARLASSGCTFNRNGSWYPAPQAKAHLVRKLEAVEGRKAVESAEQFIDLLASKSSTSGKPYLVKCGDAAPVQSAKWLAEELKTLRASRSAPPAR